MNSLNDELSTSDTYGHSAAYIEAQDSLFVEPLREYLERFGCKVVVNRRSDAVYLYAICVGDLDFVKSFYESKQISADKKLAIIYGAPDDGLSDSVLDKIKLYLVDEHPLTIEQTKKIFAFFFTSRLLLLDDRKEPNLPTRMSVMPKESPREQPSAANEQIRTDSKRIAQTMRQIFTHRSVSNRSARDKASKRILGLVWGIIGVCILPIIFYVLSLAISGLLLFGSSKALLAGNMSWTESLMQYSKAQVQNTQLILHTLSPVLSVVGLGGFAEDQDRLLSLFSDAILAESGVVTIFQTSKDVGASVLFPTNSNANTGISDVTALTSEVTRVSQHLSLIQAELDSLLSSNRFPFQTRLVAGVGNKALASLQQMRILISYTEKFLTLYPQMAGFRKRQTYLVLLQNSMELRPTGGFIGSMLLVSFADGKVDDMHVLDVYDADGQMKGHVDPPSPIREIIGQEHWYLRDSNWNPDFVISGAQAAWFYEKEMAQSVDGVIALSLPFVTNLLHVTGPIELSDFNERISEGNFFAKSLLYTQTNFFPGSKQKKDFLGALTSALLLRITGDKTISAGQLLRSVVDSVQARDLQFYFGDPLLEQLVEQWDWDGGVHIGPCQTIMRESTCIGDGVGIIEANLGINKVNYFVTHEALSDINISDRGRIDQTLTVKIKNTTPTQVPSGGGTYMDYFRVYYPKDTTVSSVKFDGVDVPARNPKQATPSAIPYRTLDASGSAMIVSVPFSVAPRAEHQLMVQTTRMTSPLTGAGSYQFTLRKQAGMSTYPWHIVVHYPPGWTATAESGVAKDGVLEYNTDLTKDAILRVVFGKE